MCGEPSARDDRDDAEGGKTVQRVTPEEVTQNDGKRDGREEKGRDKRNFAKAHRHNHQRKSGTHQQGRDQDASRHPPVKRLPLKDADNPGTDGNDQYGNEGNLQWVSRRLNKAG